MTAPMLGAIWINDLAALAEPLERRDGYAIAEVRSDQGAAQLAAVSGLGDPEVDERLGRGCRAWACWHRPEADLAAWLWVSTGLEWAPPIRRELRFAHDECYGWDASTLPQHGGHGLFAALLRHAGWRMAQEDYRWMWGGIEDANLASRCSCTAAGFRPVLRVTAIHGPRPSLRARPADYADERLVARARRMLGLPDTTSPLAPAAARTRR